jgi:hypothetical protein
MPPEMRVALEKEHGIAILPLLLRGKEIGYLLRSAGGFSSTFFVSAIGHAVDGERFGKPPGIEFDFAAPRNMMLQSTTMQYAKRLKDGLVRFDDDSQVYGHGHRDASNYRLSGNIRTQPADAATFVGQMHRESVANAFDFILLNRQAENVTLADLIDSFRGLDYEPTRLVCHFSRVGNADGGVFSARRHSGAPRETVVAADVHRTGH